MSRVFAKALILTLSLVFCSSPAFSFQVASDKQAPSTAPVKKEQAPSTAPVKKEQAQKQEPVKKEQAQKQEPVKKEQVKKQEPVKKEQVKKQEPVKAETTRLLRYPDIHGNQVVFVYAGDLWTVPVSGGAAIRLTAHEGLELSPKFSPDGKWIAFTSQYDGDEQVFVIPSRGGVPKQLTWYPIPGPNPPRRGFDHQVLGWTPDSKRILFRSGRDSNQVDALTHLYTVSLDGGLPEKLPVPVAGMGDLSPDGKKLVYSPLFRDFRHWKRYEGGWAQYLLLYNFTDKSFKKIPTTPRTDRDPMFVGQNVYFVSDRDGTMNLYRYNEQKDTVEKCTKYSDWDLRWASSDGREQIVYELGGKLYCYNVCQNVAKEIPVNVFHDGLAMQPKRINVSDNIESYDLSPKGKRLLVVARGEVFTVPAEKGNVRNLTRTSGAHDRKATWSSDGRWIAWISDKSGEQQIWIADQQGKEAPIQLTKKFTSQLDDLQWSPDGKALCVTDARNRIYVVELQKDAKTGVPTQKNIVTVASDRNGGPLQPSWSPCGQYLAYVLNTEIGYSSVYIWSRAGKNSVRITDEMFDNYSPCWDPNGDWLYFIGQREYYPLISTIEWNFAGNRFNSLFAISLRKEVKNLFAPESDEVEIKEEPKEEPKEGTEKGKSGDVKKDVKKEIAKKDGAESNAAKEKPVVQKKSKKIEFQGITGRVVRIPVSSENYFGLMAAGNYLYYINIGSGYYGRSGDKSPTLMAYDLKKRKETVFASQISGYALSPDGTKIAFRQGPAIKLTDVGPVAGEAKSVAAIAGLYVDRVPSEEWNEVFEEVWRRFRDFFYVRNMHGCDWKKIGEQYRQLLPHVAHRSDLTYVLTEMISELNVGHTYVDGGDFVIPSRPASGLPGAVFELDQKANRYRIAKIYRGQNEETKYRSPLTEVGVDVAVGDYVLEIEGEPLYGNDNPYRLLRNKEKAVTWKVSKRPDGKDARTITYVPIANEVNLRYLNFVLDRMKQVNDASKGRVGYIHIPNMGGEGAYEFIKWYYPQLRKEGIIIDDRNNGGGNISPWIIMRLNQKLLGTRFGSTRETPTTYPTAACNAHLVCLINETSASDGDIFPYYFRESGLGPIIGKRSWGGVVGISSRGPLIDGGTVYVPLSATNDTKGRYIIEGYGVEPDIEVEQTPREMLLGKDPQLQKAIEVIMKKVNSDPRKLPKRPADPVKSKRAVKKYL